ncbi:Z-DNA-binding protein 1 [Pteropus alecto]|uniref:Z-DNA-binding protein 1 n=1 Tax=Pteropus alecto TaxID=9402 RepID=L5K1E9_PTEAL|nr:Z-DNA-binding protein 1 [Pteropus alecto]ELK04328.1 Z-DNA-binding protein 1 [Pteropus alecto]
MAEGPADLSNTDLRQRILQVLRDTGSPVKAPQLQKKCGVPRKRLNQVLYQMKTEQLVVRLDLATWGLSGGTTGELVPTEPARSSQVEKPRQVAAAISGRPGSQLSEQQEKIYRLLEDGRPQNALNIAKALGKKTTKEVNPDLYAMRNKHLLDYDSDSNAWTVYRPEGSGGRNQSTAIIYQQNAINMICQNGPNSHIAIGNAKAIQIGHGNVMARQSDHDPSAPLNLPLPEPADLSAQDLPAESWGSQEICMEKSVLRRVQLGHGNKMSLQAAPATGPSCSSSGSPSGSPPVSGTAAGPETSFKIQMPAPGPHPAGDVAQRVHIRSCFLEDATIGNSNIMSVDLGEASPGEGAGPGDGSRDSEEPAEDTAPRQEATQPDEFSHGDDVSQADPDIAVFSSHLEAVTLESRDPQGADEDP